MRVFYYIVLMLLFIVQFSIKIHAEERDGFNEQVLTENNAKVSIYAGYNVHYWTIIPSIHTELSYNNDPYRILKVGVQAEYSIFSFGLEYSNNKFNTTGILGGGEENTGLDEKSHLAEQLRIFNGLTYGSFSLLVSVVYQKYNTSATSNESTDISYYTKNDGQVILEDGDSVNWFTNYRKYDIRIEYNHLNECSFFLGLRYFMHEAPTEVNISLDHSTDSGRILLYTKNRIIDPYFGGSIKKHIAGKVHSLFTVSGSMLLTYYYPESQYFDVHYDNPLSFDTFSITGVYSFEYALHYNGDHYRIEAGISAECSLANLTYDKCTLKNDITAHDMSGDVIVFNTGDNVELEFDRSEIFWGYYVRATAFF